MAEKADKMSFKGGDESKEAISDDAKRHLLKRLIAVFGKFGGIVFGRLSPAFRYILVGFLSSVDKGILPENWVSVWFAKGNLAVIGTALPFILEVLNLSKEKLTNLASGKLRKHFFSLTASEVDLRSAAGVREKFVAEFRHFCNALGVSTLTVFIPCSRRSF